MTDSHPVLAALTPLACGAMAWPAFLAALLCEEGSRSRRLAFVVVVACEALGFLTAARLPGGLGWLWAFACLTGMLHHGAVLFVDGATMRGVPLRDAVPRSFSLWMDPRRICCSTGQQQQQRRRRRRAPGRRKWTPTQRLAYACRNLGACAALMYLYMAVETAVGLLASPLFQLGHADRLRRLGLGGRPRRVMRAIYAVYWIWESFVALTVSHRALAAVFVGVVPLSGPEDWPPLWGRPAEAYTLRRFWGVFWHRAATGPLAAWSRHAARRLGVAGRGGRAEKTFVAVSVYAGSALLHLAATRRTAALLSWRETLDFSLFLLLNLAGGLVELAVCRALGRPLAAGRARGGGPAVLGRALGAAWVVCFFLCAMPPWTYPYFRRHQRQVRFKMKDAQ